MTLRTASFPPTAPLLAGLAVGLVANASAPAITGLPVTVSAAAVAQAPPSPTADPRIGLRPGLFDAGEAIWNLRLVSTTPPAREFVGVTNSDLSFTGPYAIQGNYNGFQVWDLSDAAAPAPVKSYVCPASQSDVSVYRHLLFVSGEGLGGRLDCGTEGVPAAVSHDRLRGIRIFDIADIRRPRYVANVQTCRGSHTHSVVEDPNDPEHVYIYVSGSAPVRPEAELPGCSAAPPEEDPNTALFRIEVIRVPVAHPERVAIVSSPRIFAGLVAPPRHGPTAEDLAAIEEARARGEFVIDLDGEPTLLRSEMAAVLLDSIVAARGGTGMPTAADSATLRRRPDVMRAAWMARRGDRARGGPTQCHDITVYPAIGLAGGACEGYGLLLDIRDPANPVRIAEVSDSNFAYWHSATFNYYGTKVLFTDEWGGGRQPKCRASDPREWGANAIFTVEDRRMRFRSYYKLPVAQTPLENCVAHNGSLIPVPGRDVMVQGWYQGGISVFDWTDPDHPVEIAFHDRGPVDSARAEMAGSWSAYWYNGVIVSSEIARGLDVFELVSSAHLTQNEIDAAKTVRLDYLNAQGQPRFAWPATFALARAYVDQLERSGGLPAERIATLRRDLAAAERASGAARRDGLSGLVRSLEGATVGSPDAAKVRLLAATLGGLAGG